MLPNLHVASTNAAFTGHFCTPEQARKIQDAPCHEILCGRSAPCDACPVAQVFEHGTVCHSEIQSGGEGRSRVLYATAMPIKTPFGDTDEVLVMLQDMS